MANLLKNLRFLRRFLKKSDIFFIKILGGRYVDVYFWAYAKFWQALRERVQALSGLALGGWNLIGDWE